MNRESDYLEESKIDLSDTHTHTCREETKDQRKNLGASGQPTFLGMLQRLTIHTHIHTHTHTAHSTLEPDMSLIPIIGLWV